MVAEEDAQFPLIGVTATLKFTESSEPGWNFANQSYRIEGTSDMLKLANHHIEVAEGEIRQICEDLVNKVAKCLIYHAQGLTIDDLTEEAQE